MALPRSFVFITFVSVCAFVLVRFTMADASCPLLDKFCGKYYFNDDRRYNFVAAEKFASEDEKLKMIRLFRPNARSEDDLFVHDTLYNIETAEQGNKLVMTC